ncbi:hypothetical protein SCHPADRAFT_889863 [Schizopora paradoxa]|uniref:Uncharacterized protein n=1 Tax=Schizopora paradoxa TaxID=27342 RepID=A0A0H2S9V4_9AGAM|nr:hypothetical protein SCHPADRAFT_889863 [Schizopora paradoxa]
MLQHRTQILRSISVPEEASRHHTDPHADEEHSKRINECTNCHLVTCSNAEMARLRLRIKWTWCNRAHGSVDFAGDEGTNKYQFKPPRNSSSHEVFVPCDTRAVDGVLCDLGGISGPEAEERNLSGKGEASIVLALKSRAIETSCPRFGLQHVKSKSRRDDTRSPRACTLQRFAEFVGRQRPCSFVESRRSELVFEAV